MEILKEAKKFEWKREGEKIISDAKEIGMSDISLEKAEIMRYFGITTKEKMDRETMEKINTIYDYLKEAPDILGELRRIDSKLGNPVKLKEKLDKIYSFVYSENLEKGLQKEREMGEKLETKETGEKKEKENILIQKKETEMAERIEIIRKIKPEEKQKKFEIRIYV